MSLPFIFSSNPPHLSSPEKPWLSSSAGGAAADVRRTTSLSRKKNSSADKDNYSDRFLTSGVPGGRSQQAMRKILKTLKTLPRSPHQEEIAIDFSILNSLEAISPRREEPWANSREEGMEIPRSKKKRILPAAEVVLPAAELDRMREEARGMKKWIRGKKAGVTLEVMKGIRREWRKNELAMVKIVYPLRGNMVRAHEIVEVCENFWFGYGYVI